MYEASKQCERAIVPVCELPASLETVVNSKRFDKIIAFCERCAVKTLRDFFLDTPIKKDENVLTHLINLIYNKKRRLKSKNTIKKKNKN